VLWQADLSRLQQTGGLGTQLSDLSAIIRCMSKPAESQNPQDHEAVQRLLQATYLDLQTAMQRSQGGVSTQMHELDQTVTFMLDNHQEVVLRVRKIDIEHRGKEVLSMRVHCRTDFENVLILAQKLRMKIAAFSVHFTVVLSASPEFIQDWGEKILLMDHPARFFETLDELKRPIFLNLNHYVIARISD